MLFRSGEPMEFETRPSGLVLPVKQPDKAKELPPQPVRRLEYRVARYNDWDAASRHLESMWKKGGELLSITRHGKCYKAFKFEADMELGYVITYYCDRAICVEELT